MERSADRSTVQSGKEGAGLPMTMRYGADCPLSAGCEGVGPRHVGLNPGLVEEDEVFGDQAWLVLSPRRPRGGDVRTVLLGGMECLFLRVRPKADRYRCTDVR